jgi:hypothetical protein
LGVETRFRQGRRLSSAITGDGRPHEPSANNSIANAPSFLAVGATEGVGVELAILLGGPAEEVDLVRAKEASRNHEALAGIFRHVAVVERTGVGCLCHEVPP